MGRRNYVERSLPPSFNGQFDLCIPIYILQLFEQQLAVWPQMFVVIGASVQLRREISADPVEKKLAAC